MKVIVAIALLAVVACAAARAEYVVLRASDPASGQVCGQDANAVQEPAVFTLTRTAYHGFLDELELNDGQSLPRFNFETLSTGVLGDDTPIVLNAPDASSIVNAALKCAVPGCNLNIKTEGAQCPSNNGRFPIDVNANHAVGQGGSYLDASGSQWLDLEFNDDFVLEFAEPVKGFAFFASDIGDVTGSLELAITLADGSSLQYNGQNLPLFANEQGQQQASGVRTFWGIFTSDPNIDTWFKSIRFVKDVANPNAKDGFGFDTLLALPESLIIDPIDPVCPCITVFNSGNNCQANIGGNRCVCIRHVVDPTRAACETEPCADQLPLPDIQNEDGVKIPFISDFSNNFSPAIVRF